MWDDGTYLHLLNRKNQRSTLFKSSGFFVLLFTGKHTRATLLENVLSHRTSTSPQPGVTSQPHLQSSSHARLRWPPLGRLVDIADPAQLRSCWRVMGYISRHQSAGRCQSVTTVQRHVDDQLEIGTTCRCTAGARKVCFGQQDRLKDFQVHLQLSGN